VKIGCIRSEVAENATANDTVRIASEEIVFGWRKIDGLN
jgi:hypothetical protein